MMNKYTHPLASLIDYFNFEEDTRKYLLNDHQPGEYITKEDIFDLINWIGIQGNKEEEAKELVFDLDERINIVTHKLKFIDEGQKPSVLILEQSTPILSTEITGDYLEHVIGLAGGKPYNSMDEEGHFLNPDVILFAVRKPMEQVLGDLAQTISQEKWQQTNAVKNNRIFLVDYNVRLAGNGAGIADDVELLGEILYPKYLTFSGEGSSWIQFNL